MVLAYIRLKSGYHRVVESEDKTGHSNPFAHLKSYYGGKDQVNGCTKVLKMKQIRQELLLELNFQSLTENEKGKGILDWCVFL